MICCHMPLYFIISDLTEEGYHRKMERSEALLSTSSEGVHERVTTPSRQLTRIQMKR